MLLFLATTLNYLDRQTMGILAPILQKEMRFGRPTLTGAPPARLREEIRVRPADVDGVLETLGLA